MRGDYVITQDFIFSAFSYSVWFLRSAYANLSAKTKLCDDQWQEAELGRRGNVDAVGLEEDQSKLILQYHEAISQYQPMILQYWMDSSIVIIIVFVPIHFVDSILFKTLLNDKTFAANSFLDDETNW